MEEPEPRVAIIGLGRLGTHLAMAMAPMSPPDAPLIATTSEPLKGEALVDACRELTPEGIEPSLPEVLEDTNWAAAAADLIFLCVPDKVLPDAAQTLAQGPVAGKVFVHCSGAAPTYVLNPLKEAGALVGGFHPIQSFTKLSRGQMSKAPDVFQGIVFGIEADEPVYGMLESLATALGADSARIGGGVLSKANYHAAAVVASNALVALLADALAIMNRAGLDDSSAAKALLPLMNGTLGNLKKKAPADALTGPVARGDLLTIERHLEALKDDDELLSTYVHLAARTVTLASRGNRISNDEAESIMSALQKAVEEGAGA